MCMHMIAHQKVIPRRPQAKLWLDEFKDVFIWFELKSFLRTHRETEKVILSQLKISMFRCTRVYVHTVWWAGMWKWKKGSCETGSGEKKERKEIRDRRTERKKGKKISKNRANRWKDLRSWPLQNKEKSMQWKERMTTERKRWEHLCQIVDGAGEEKNQDAVKKQFAQTHHQASCLQTRLQEQRGQRHSLIHLHCTFYIETSLVAMIWIPWYYV